MVSCTILSGNDVYASKMVAGIFPRVDTGMQWKLIHMWYIGIGTQVRMLFLQRFRRNGSIG